MIKMDHSELIRNTNFEDQRELVETITGQQAQIQHLTILLSEQKINFEMNETQAAKEVQSLESKVSVLEQNLESAQSQKTAIEKQMTLKCKDLEEKLEKATQEKEAAYKNQMDKIHENLETLKEQIQSTNQSLADQSMIGLQQHALDTSSMAGGPPKAFVRMQSPDSRNQRDQALSVSSPRIPRVYAHLDQRRDNQRMRSPLAADVSRRLREKSREMQHRVKDNTKGS